MRTRAVRTLRIVAAVGCIALLGLAVAGYALARSDMAKEWLRGRIATALSPRLLYRDVHVSVWPRFGAVLDRVSLRPAEGDAESAVVSADAISCRLGLRALLDGRVDVQTVVIDGLALTVARSAAGDIRIEGLEPLPEMGPSAGAAWPALQLHDARITLIDAARPGPPRTIVLAPIDARLVPDGAGSNFELTLDGSGGAHLLVRGTSEQRSLDSPLALHAELEDVDAAAAAEWLASAEVQPTASGRVRATLALRRSGGSIDGEAVVELADGGVTVRDWHGVSPLKLSAQVAWSEPTFSLADGRAELARLEHGGIAAETLRASFAYADGALQVRGAEARAFGGHWTQSGQITLADPVVVDGGLRGEQIDSAQLLAALPALGVSAALPQADGTLTVTLDGRGTVGVDLGGHASVALAGGGVSWDGVRVAAPLQLAADVAVAGGAPALTNGQARAAKVSRGGLAADAVDVQFSYAADALRVAPLKLIALGGTWTYSGTLPVRAGGPWSGTLAANGVRVEQAGAAAATFATDSAPAGAPPSGALDVRATLSSGPRDSVGGNASLRLASPALEWEDVRVTAPASVSAGVRFERGQLVLSRGRLDAGRISLAGNAAHDLSAQFNGTQDRLQVSGLTARAFGGAWQANGTVAPAAWPPFSGTVSGTGVRLGPLLIAAGQGDGDAPSSPTGIADLRLTLAPAAGGAIGGNATVQLHSGAFLLGDLMVDAPAQFTSDVTLRDGDLALRDATASAGRAMFGKLGGTQAKGQFSYAQERLTFTALQFTAGGGAWSHTGTYSFAGKHLFSGHLTIRDADPRGILLLLSANEPSTLDLEHLDADIDFRGRAVDDWSDTLEASGDLLVRGGTMRSSAVLRAMWEAMFGKSASMDKLGSPNRVDSAGGTFALEAGVVHTQDLALHSADFIATAAGTFALAGPIDLAARFTMTAQGMQKMIAFGSIALPTSSLPPLPPIPAKITGTLDDPIVRPNMAAVPAATLRWFVDAVLHAPRGVLGAVVNRGREAWDATRRLFGRGAAESE